MKIDSIDHSLTKSIHCSIYLFCFLIKQKPNNTSPLKEIQTWTCNASYLLVNWSTCHGVSDCYLILSEQFFSHIMARISYISSRWWLCLLCARPMPQVGFAFSACPLKQLTIGRHIGPNTGRGCHRFNNLVPFTVFDFFSPFYTVSMFVSFE